MRSVTRLSVRARLSLAFLSVILLSWGLSAASFVYVRSVLHPEFRPGPGPPPEAYGATAPERGVPGGKQWMPRPDWPPPPPPPPPKALLAAQLAMAFILSICAGAWLSRRFTRPLDALASGAKAFEDGDLDHRVPEDRQDEFARVARTMNAMAARMKRQIAALEDDAHRRQQLLADLAHELRSPVATLKTMTEALRDGLADEPARRRRALAATGASVDRLERLVNDMLVIARLDLHQLPLENVEVDLREAARSCIEAQRARAEVAGVSLLPVPGGEPVVVLADKVRLAQVLDNLLDNAVSHAGAGAEVRVALSAGPPRTVTVSDTGGGIPPEHLSSLFDPFFRVDPSRSPTAVAHHVGLGLRIARGLVEAHGGTLTLESEVGHGTTAAVTLPATAPVD